jgi:hypothetical protein
MTQTVMATWMRVRKFARAAGGWFYQVVINDKLFCQTDGG